MACSSPPPRPALSLLSSAQLQERRTQPLTLRDYVLQQQLHSVVALGFSFFTLRTNGVLGCARARWSKAEWDAMHTDLEGLGFKIQKYSDEWCVMFATASVATTPVVQ